MRFVFLDFDGVLNSQALVDASPAPVPGLDLLAEDAVNRVESLSAATGAAIVVSSTWRLAFDLEALERMLRVKGLAAAPIVGVTPFIPHKRGRGQEIQRWLDEVPPARGWSVEGIVILDDQPDMLHLMPWLVLSSFDTGLTEADVARARSILQAPPPTTGAFPTSRA